MKKITFKLKNAFNTPKNSISTIVGLLASLALMFFSKHLDPATIGGSLTILILGALAGHEKNVNNTTSR